MDKHTIQLVLYLLFFIVSYCSEFSAVQSWMESYKRRSDLLKVLNTSTDRCVVFQVESKPDNKDGLKIFVKQINRNMKKMIKNCLPNLKTPSRIVQLTLQYLKIL